MSVVSSSGAGTPQGNRCCRHAVANDWASVQLHVPTNLVIEEARAWLLASIVRVTFHRDATRESSATSNGAPTHLLVPPTLPLLSHSRGRISDCIVSQSVLHVAARVHHSTLHRAFIAAGATVTHSRVTARDGSAAGVHAELRPFGIGTRVFLGSHASARSFQLHDCAGPAHVHSAVSSRAGAARFEQRAAARRAAYLQLAAPWLVYPFSYIGTGAVLHACPDVRNVVCLGSVSLLHAHVTDSLLVGADAAPTLVSGAACEACILHPGCVVDSYAVVTSSLLMPLSGARKGAMVTDAVLSPLVVVSAAEVTASLVGPLTALHHRSLLIACLAPRGKVTCAANSALGSNHTGRTPDQEMHAGEGVFFGLSCAVKYPVNLDAAPFTLIAAGTTMLPQRVTMPFSLINGPGTHTAAVRTLSPAINEIMPGWMLSDNVYALYRNEIKHTARAAALTSVHHAIRDAVLLEDIPSSADYRSTWTDVHSTAFATDVFARADIAALVEAAATQLTAAKRPKWTLTGPLDAASEPVPKHAVYTEAELPGLGKNFMTEAARQRGFQAYTRFLRTFANRALARTLLSSGRNIRRRDVGDAAWAAACKIGLLRDAGDASDAVVPAHDAREILREYSTTWKDDAEAAATSKQRDTERGVRIADDYAYAHSDADPVIAHLRATAQEAARRVEEWCRSQS